MRKIAWRWTLPIAQVAIAAALIWWGNAQEANHVAKLKAEAQADLAAAREHLRPGEIVITPDESMTFSSWGYTPTAHQLLGAINAPAMVALFPVRVLENNAIQPFFMNRLLASSLLLLFVWVQWWCVGAKLDGRLRIQNRSLRKALAIGGLVMGLLSAMELVSSYWGHSPILHLGLLVWTVFFIAYSFRFLPGSLSKPPAH